MNIDRILTAVGFVPDDLDRDGLRSDLEGVASIYRTGVSLRQAPAKREQKVARIVEAAEHLESLIMGEPHLQRHCPALKRLVADAKQELFPSQLVEMLGPRQVSAFENLVGRWLRDVFVRHFDKPAGATRNAYSDEITQPFVDFAEAALEELGIDNNGAPYSRNSIAYALSKVRNM